MASRNTFWRCQICSVSYICLFDVVSHVRAVHSAESHLNFVCNVNNCPGVFNKTNSWYRHVVDKHFEQYYKRNPDPLYIACESDHEEAEEEEEGLGDMTEHLPPIQDTVVSTHLPTFMSEEAVAGKLLKFKERHRISHTAIDEVVELVQTSCDHVVMKTLSAVWESGEVHGMDMDSDFFKELPDILESVVHPLSSLETAYKQQSYVSKKLPYVVCY